MKKIMTGFLPLSADTDTLISLVDFPGPTVLIPDNAQGDDCLLGARICVTFSSARDKGDVDVFLHRPKSSITVKAAATAQRRNQLFVYII